MVVNTPEHRARLLQEGWSTIPLARIRNARSRITSSSAPTTTVVATVGEVLEQVLDEHDLSGRVEPV
jgi:hypothetical protein